MSILITTTLVTLVSVAGDYRHHGDYDGDRDDKIVLQCAVDDCSVDGDVLIMMATTTAVMLL